MKTLKTRAFTLVELAIVITIIGLLIGGVLKGQELLENARMTSGAANLKSYETAVTTFRDIYKAKPGDMLEARNFLEGCTAANTCNNGNGDSSIGIGFIPHGGDGISMTAENTQFWKHLAAAKLINGIDLSASALDWGKSHPTFPLGGGFTGVTVAPSAETEKFIVGMGNIFVLRLHKVLGGAADASPALSAHRLSLFDLKIDDGLPFTGIVHGAGMGVDVAPCEANASGVVGRYDGGSNGLCELYYLLF